MQSEKADNDTEKNDTNDTTRLKSEDNNGDSSQNGNFQANFKAFSKFGDTKSDGKSITLSQSDKWMKQAKVIDGKKITTTDTGIYFKKHKYVKHLTTYYLTISSMNNS